MNLVSYPVVRYRFTFAVIRPFYLPDYAGSMLRGMFGWSLKKLSVASRFDGLIGRRELYNLCPYTMMFEPPPPEEHKIQKFSNVPAPYVIEPPAWGTKDLVAGDVISFNMVLAGHARHQLPYVIAAWRGAMAGNIGREKGSAELVKVECLTERGDVGVYHHHAPAIVDHPITTDFPSGPFPAADTAIEVLTPMRVQQGGRPLSPQAITARPLLTALVRRIGLITEFHTGLDMDIDYSGLSRRAGAVTIETDLEWLDWRRYSSRQKQKMSFGGVIGTILLGGDIGPFLPYLYLGQWLHLGKNTTFGLGKYKILSKNSIWKG